MSITLGIILSFCAAFCWGTGMIIFKVGVNKVDALTGTFLRGIVVIPLFFIVGILLYGIKSISVQFMGENLIWLLTAALTIALGDFFSLIALKRVDASVAQPISAIYPLFTTLILVMFSSYFGENITLFIILGTLFNISGVIVISLFSNRQVKEENAIKSETSNNEEDGEIEGKNSSNTQGIIAAILAAIFWGTTIVLTKQLVIQEGVEIISMMGVRNGIMVFCAGVLTLINISVKKQKGQAWNKPTRKDIIILAIGGIITWFGGGVSFFNATTMIGAARSTPISSISPFIVLVWGRLFLKEKIRIPQIFGVALIVAGSVLLSL